MENLSCINDNHTNVEGTQAFVVLSVWLLTLKNTRTRFCSVPEFRVERQCTASFILIGTFSFMFTVLPILSAMQSDWLLNDGFRFTSNWSLSWPLLLLARRQCASVKQSGCFLSVPLAPLHETGHLVLVFVRGPSFRENNGCSLPCSMICMFQLEKRSFQALCHVFRVRTLILIYFLNYHS